MLAADVILHVRDIQHPDSEEQATDVKAILSELSVTDSVPHIEVWNKIDLLEPDVLSARLTKADRTADVVAVSALTGAGIDELLSLVSDRLQGTRQHARIDLPFTEGKKRAWLHEQGVVERESQDDTGFHIAVHWSPIQRAKFDRL